MSRYYSLTISDPATGKIFVPNVGGKAGFTLMPAGPNIVTYTSLNGGMNIQQVGSTNPAALRVELDMPVAAQHTPQQGSYVKIHGVSLAEIGQASNLNGANFKLYGGMAKGLPLAQPKQAGLLASGQVYVSFGNWLGTKQSLDIFTIAGGSSPSAAQTTGNPSTYLTTPAPVTNANPGNFIFTWKSGTPLMPAVVQTLSQVYPKYQIAGAINPNLVLSGAPETGVFATLPQFAAYIHDLSQSLIGGYAPDRSIYLGVNITLQDNIISIYDGSTQTTPKQIAFNDLIGQPTWVGPAEVQATVAMRGDIQVNNFVTLPPGLHQATAASQLPGSSVQATQLNQGSIFTGEFIVTKVRHIGDSRAASAGGDGAATAWATTLDLLAIKIVSAKVNTLPVIYKSNNAYGFHLP